MNFLRLITSSLRFHFRIHVAVALGVAVATAVLTGALLVGDSMRGSLRNLTLDRLQRIDELFVVDRFFRTDLAKELAANDDFKNAGYFEAVPAILLASTSLESNAESGGRASGVLTIGCEERFWSLANPDDHYQSIQASPFVIQSDEIVLNQPLADELKVQAGDTVTLRLAAADQVPADSPLGRKENLTRSIPGLKVKTVLPAKGLGRFALRPNQSLPKNAYVSLALLQRELEQEEKANAILVAGGKADRPPSVESSERLADSLRPTLHDLGMQWQHVERKDDDVYDYYQLTSDRMLLDPQVVDSAVRSFADHKPQRVFTYLANLIERLPTSGGDDVERKPISYSTITAVDSNAELGPALTADDTAIPLAEGEIVINDWAARDQGFEVGDRVRITYFAPETTHGEAEERQAIFTLRGIAPLDSSNGRPTPANDPYLTPEVQGVTDKDSIAKWDAPFRVDYSRVRPQDDKYWEDYRTTPKAFVSLRAGQQLWGSRWGEVTAVRLPGSAASSAQELEQRLLEQMREQNVTLGFEFQAVKRRDLAASSGTTPFDVLFLLLSMFIVAAAIMLVVLLFRLGVEQRAREIGVLLGLGWTRRKIAGWLLGEGAIVASVGAAAGVLGGLGYASLLLVGLRTWWVGAVSTPFLQMHWTWRSLAIGFLVGFMVSVLAILWGLRGSRRVAIRRLLAGQLAEDYQFTTAKTNFTAILAIVLLMIAVGLAYMATRLRADAQAGAFLGSGAAVLIAVLLVVRSQLRSGAEAVSAIGGAPLTRLAFRSAARNPSRSVLTLALMSSASFLIVALAAFRLNPETSGSGGFEYVAETAQPLHIDLNDHMRQQELLADEASLLANSRVLPFRLQPGDDASCRNLYQSTQPRVLGVTPAMIEHYDDTNSTRFHWSSSDAATAEERANPWRLLAGSHGASEPVPVVIDQNTAMYSLQLYRGTGEEFEKTYPGGQVIRFRIVGLLSNSVLQGGLLIGEEDFKGLFPQSSGYRFFLVQTTSEGISALERVLSDQGFDATRADVILADLMAVQNTYLSTFQALGALGLVLGTFGLAAVQLRSILERRGELGLMRAAGFAKSRLVTLVMLENIVLLLGGLVIGTVAALVAVLPHMVVGGARPPLAELAIMLGVVVVVGALVGWLAVRRTLHATLISALRGE